MSVTTSRGMHGHDLPQAASELSRESEIESEDDEDPSEEGA